MSASTIIDVGWGEIIDEFGTVTEVQVPVPLLFCSFVDHQRVIQGVL
jgi:hypothetical protein